MAKRSDVNKTHSSSFRVGIGFLVATIISSTMYFGGQISNSIMTSVLGSPDHEPFDGTVNPIQKVPDWVQLDSSRWDLSYPSLNSNEIVDIPFYDPAELATSTDNLTWGNASDDDIRNAKITYSTPYMGSYLLNGKEGDGSHPAVDIKIPNGTPVFAIANGTVVKVSNQNSGFGHHIVIQHNNFPTLDNANATETIYSSYSHLGDILISKGVTVKKGEQIALSGETGTATTPHLHFQIDNDEAPWHPFWPFSWSEISKVGLDFFGAINAGFAQDKAYATTINPMKYVQAYDGGGANYTPAETTDDAADEPADSNSGSGPTADSHVPEVSEEPVVVADEPEVVEEIAEVVEEEEVEAEPEVVEEVIVEEIVLDPPELTFEFEVREKYYIGQKADFSVLLRDQYGEVYKNGFDGDIVVSAVDGLVTAQNAIVSHFKFDNDGEFMSSFKRMDEGRDRLKLDYDGVTYYSDWFNIENQGNVVAFSDLPADHEYYDAVTYLVTEGVVAGYPDKTFRPDKTVSRVEALKFIFEGINEVVSEGETPFPDVSASEWYGRYLHTAYTRGVVSGYADGTFRPTNTVNKAEFYKILFNGMAVDVNPNVEGTPFKDVGGEDWFAPYVYYAKEIGIIDHGVRTLEPSNGMSRGEVAYAIYRLMLMMK